MRHVFMYGKHFSTVLFSVSLKTLHLVYVWKIYFASLKIDFHVTLVVICIKAEIKQVSKVGQTDYNINFDKVCKMTWECSLIVDKINTRPLNPEKCILFTYLNFSQKQIKKLRNWINILVEECSICRTKSFRYKSIQS